MGGEGSGNRTLSGERTNYFDPGSMRKIPQEFRRTFKVSEVWEIHHEIARRLSLGHKNKDIAKELGITEQMVSYTKNSPVIEKKVAIMRGAMDADTVDLGIRINQLAPKALDLLEEVMSSGTILNKDVHVNQIIKVADKQLDRAGYAPVKKIAVATGKLTPEDIEGIKERARSAGLVRNIRKESKDETIDVTSDIRDAVLA